MFDRMSINGSLAFQKDDILYVDNTMYNGVPGLWQAWLVDEEGEKIKCGFIPSKYKYVIRCVKKIFIYNAVTLNMFTQQYITDKTMLFTHFWDEMWWYFAFNTLLLWHFSGFLLTIVFILPISHFCFAAFKNKMAS